MTAADTTPEALVLRERVDALFLRKRLMAFGVPGVILAYLVYVFFAFDVPGLAERARLDNAAILVSDAVSYKTHVTRDNRSGEVQVSIEGSRRLVHSEATLPGWVQMGETTVVDLEGGHKVTFEGAALHYDVPDYGRVTVTRGEAGIALETPGAAVPDWISASDSRVNITTDAGRISITNSRSEVMRYEWGWEAFFFTPSSAFYPMTWGERFAALVSGEQIEAGRSNIGLMWTDFWGNGLWRHGEVAWALFETILMAFLGTLGAAVIALPLAFLAARNFAPSVPARFGVRRIFDFVRGVDALIWTIVLSRAFGPGPMTGALAIMVTDSGSFGKLFSEALENVDGKQIEGVQSTGARPIQRYRFGVIPQVAPVLLSQVLYFLESNTRSATIIGAIVGGGIGLMLTQAIQTTSNWEQVTYYIILIVLMVILMDWFSGWLRGRLVKGK